MYEGSQRTFCSFSEKRSFLSAAVALEALASDAAGVASLVGEVAITVVIVDGGCSAEVAVY